MGRNEDAKNGRSIVRCAATGMPAPKDSSGQNTPRKGQQNAVRALECRRPSRFDGGVRMISSVSSPAFRAAKQGGFIGARAAALVLWALSFDGTVLAADGARQLDEPITIDVRQDTDLEAALIDWGIRAGMTVMINSVTVERRLSSAVQGTMKARDALAILLRGSGLTYTVEGGRIRIIPASGFVRSVDREVDSNTSVLSESATDTSTEHVDEKSGGKGNDASQRNLAEVIVTAQKRAERVEDVPTSMTVLDGDEISKTEPLSLSDLSGYVPGFFATNSTGVAGRTQLTIRGVATDSAGLGALVATYVDDTQVGSSSAAVEGSVFTLDMMPYDIERIEVLNGPQGTLYGAGAMGGLLKYVFRAPELNVFEGHVGGSASYIDRTAGISGGERASVNIPLIHDRLALRISAYEQRTQGYIDNVALGVKHWNPATQKGGRFSALFQATDTLSIKVTALIQQTLADGEGTVQLDPLTLQSVGGPFGTIINGTENFSSRTQLYSAAVDWNLPFAALTSTTSWQRFHIRENYDATYQQSDTVNMQPGGPFPGNTEPEPLDFNLKGKFTEELRLASITAERFQWMLGLYFTREYSLNQQQILALDANGVPIPTANPLLYFYLPWDYREQAAFTNVSYKFTDNFEVSAGGRYARNEQTSAATAYGVFVNGLTPPSSPETVNLSEGVFTWMVSPQYHFSKDSMVYLRAANGYRPGGYSFALNPGVPTIFGPDKLTNYELGVKSVMLDGKLSLDFSVYDIEWKNIQVNIVDPRTQFNYFGNGATARSRGFETAAYVSPAKGLRVGVTLGLVDAHLTSDAPGIGAVSGAKLPFSSPLTASLRVDYNHALANGMTLQAGGGYRYATNSEASVEAPGALLVQQPRPVDVYAGLDFGRGTLRLFVRNAFNSQPIPLKVDQPTPGPPYPPLVPELPRTVGMNVDFQF